jgi:hypothetical protein
MLIVPFVLGVIYWLLLHDLPFYAIRQCMPYFGDDQPYHASPLQVIPYFLMQNWLTFIHTPIGIAIGVVLHGCTLLAIYLLISKKLEKEYRQDILIGLAILGIFFVFYFHEFLRIMSLLFLGGLTAIGVVAHIGIIQSQKQPFRYLAMDRGHIYVGNEPQWTDTVNKVTFFLNTTLTKDDYFFAMPYDCLYYYLTGKESPTRQLIFFNHIKIPPEQDVSVIKELESHQTNYVLMSSRIISNETGLGIFGKTYCPILSQFINSNYVPIGRLGGDWNQPPGWANNHGVILLKRKSLSV